MKARDRARGGRCLISANRGGIESRASASCWGRSCEGRLLSQSPVAPPARPAEARSAETGRQASAGLAPVLLLSAAGSGILARPALSKDKAIGSLFRRHAEKVTAKITSFCASSQREEINMDPAPQNRS